MALATETKTDGQTIVLQQMGLLEGIDTTAFLEGDILYLGTSGNITKVHPTGIYAVQRVGHAVKINAGSGSILIELDPLTIINDHNGILRHQIVNQNAGTSASAAYTVVNDADHRASMSMVGSGFADVAGIAESQVIYNEGYNKTVFAVDGAYGYEWWTDETDSHDLSSTPKMWLSSAGELKILQQCIAHTASSNDDHAVEILADANGYGDVKALDIDYITGTIGVSDNEGVVLVQIDESLSTGGEVFALEVLTTTVGNAKVVAVKTGVGVDIVEQFSGIFEDISTILNKAVDVTTELSQGGAGNISIFVADNDTITVGSAAKFEELEFILSQGADKGQGVKPVFEFSTGVGTWATFTPSDGTNGFKNTGDVLWDDANIPSWAVGTGTEYLVRITRTENNNNTTPIVELVQGAAPDLFNWDKDGNVSVNTLKATGTPVYADNSAALVGGLVDGDIYRTGDLLKIVH